MSKEHLEPAATIIAKIGVAKIAQITGKHESRVYRWRMSKEKGGTDGVVPHGDAQKLIASSPIDGVEIAPSDFFASAKEVAA